MRDYKQTVRELRDPHFVYHFSRDYLKNMMDDAADAIEELCELVDSNKTAVKHGRWIIRDNPGTGWYRVTCSECGEDVTSVVPVIGFFPDAKVIWDYCPCCGAKMDAEGGEEHGHHRSTEN